MEKAIIKIEERILGHKVRYYDTGYIRYYDTNDLQKAIIAEQNYKKTIENDIVKEYAFNQKKKELDEMYDNPLVEEFYECNFDDINWESTLEELDIELNEKSSICWDA